MEPTTGELLQQQIDDLKTEVSIKNYDDEYKSMNNRILNLEHYKRSNDFILIGFNVSPNGNREPIFAASVDQELDTESLEALGVSTNPTKPFYFVFSQLRYLRHKKVTDINLYEINQYSHFCDYNLTILVEQKSLEAHIKFESFGSDTYSIGSDNRANKRKLHIMASMNGRNVTYKPIDKNLAPSAQYSTASI